uniref:Uncharacterized protein n=1 Tax=Leucosporidium scottii TaxID=5278 RepID=A0A0H5FTK5_9BASI|nr:hypothetical protein [Leucosporidium scottii]
MLPSATPLVVLSTWITISAVDPDQLVALLKLPALAELKRWRDQLSDDPTLVQEIWGPWAAACEAKGVEPRGRKRFFTARWRIAEGVQRSSELMFVFHVRVQVSAPLCVFKHSMWPRRWCPFGTSESRR